MKVAYFSNQFADKHGHGIARYSRELFTTVTQQQDIEMFPVAAWSSLDHSSLQKLVADTRLQILPLGRRITPLSWLLFNAPALETSLPVNIDLVHAASLGYPIATRKPYVVTIHDLGPLTHPEYFANKTPWIMKYSLKQAVRKAERFICVSRSTADELIDYVGSDIEDRVVVIHEGVNAYMFAQPGTLTTARHVNMPPADVPFILSTGKISPRKNIQGLLNAYQQIVDRIPHHLVLVGGDGWDMDHVKQQLADSRLADRVHLLGYVSDADLRSLYNQAALYVHPSLYEGFGLTVLEAMACGCPVVTSNVYSLPEVAGDAAKLVDPKNVEQLADAIVSLCSDRELAAQYTHKGMRRSETFTWDRCAQQVIDVYRDVVSGY